MRKGVSPLLAWVLLVAFALTMGAFIMNWATKQVKQFDPSKDADLYCPEVDFAVSDVCLTDIDGPLQFIVTNTGSYTITRLTVARETSIDKLGSCYFLNLGDPLDPGIKPGEDDDLELKLGGTLISGYNQANDCDGLIDPTGPGVTFTSVEIVPWIEVNDQSIVCSDNKKELNSALFSNPCT